MELKASSPKSGGLSPLDCVSDPDEKEISDDDDDDRNHKHRRRGTRSQSLERDATEPVMTRSFRKRGKNFGSRFTFRENESQASETLKTFNNASMEKDFSSKFDRRRLGLTAPPRAPFDLSQRFRMNQSINGDHGPGRGRGRDSASWNQRDSRFSSVDITSQMVQPGSVPPSIYAGRGLSNVNNAQSASWNAFGLIPGMPNGGLDMLHPIGLQGTIRPPINSSLTMGIPRQRCRDFEERGFCLRGDMCPMEHGINRIVIEDVQSLSQFNLPVSIPSAHLIGTASGSGPLQSGSTSTSMNNKGIPGKFCKPGIGDSGLGLNGAYPGSGSAGGADFYDPDQPLWNDSCPETSNALLTMQSHKMDETETLCNDVPFDCHHARLSDGADNDCPDGTTGTSINSLGGSSSVWGRIGGSKNRFNVKEKTSSAMSSFQYSKNEDKDDNDELAGIQGALRQGKQILSENADPKAVYITSRAHNNDVHNLRKATQKAQRTLFVSGIPKNSNRRENLLLHFQKFGEVIDIYIPPNGEKAFVQFSTREEAEAALKAPDAVMSNRFIRLHWANRDNVPDDGVNSGPGVSVPSPSQSLVPSNTFVSGRGKDILHQSNPKTTSDSLPTADHPKPVAMNEPKVIPPLQKKLETYSEEMRKKQEMLDQMRKKQEMLDQMRNDFRRKLDKLEKQTSGLKGEFVNERDAKRPKVATASDVSKPASPKTSDSGSAAASPHSLKIADKTKLVDNSVFHNPKSSTIVAMQEPSSLKQPIRPLAPLGPLFAMNRYKLDNRPTAFRVMPPLPSGIASVAVLREHFSSYGELSAVELEDPEVNDNSNKSEAALNCSAQISFSTRHAAERAFINGKCWNGHNLKFTWLASPNPTNSNIGREKSPSAFKGPSNTEEKLEYAVSKEATAAEDALPSKSETNIQNEHVEPSRESQQIPFEEESSPKGDVR